MSDIERTLVAAMRESDHAISVSPHARERYLQLAGPGSRDAVPGLLRRRRTQVMLAAAVAVVAVIGTVVAPLAIPAREPWTSAGVPVPDADWVAVPAWNGDGGCAVR